MIITKKQLRPFILFLIFILIIVSFIILNFSRGTKGSILNEFIIFFKQPYLVSDVEPNVKDLLSSIVKSTLKINYLKNNYTKVKIHLPFRELVKLKEDRKKALDLHPTEEFLYQKTWVNGEIEVNKKFYKAKIRLKGDRADHWGRNNRWSFHIKLDNDQHIFGFNRFSITNHKARAFPQNEVISNSLQSLGIKTLDFKTIELSFNGNDWGLMYIEEHFGNTFFEKRKIKETPIARFTNQAGAELIARSKNKNNSSENLSKIYFLTEKKNIKIYNPKKYLREKNTRNIISLFQSVKENTSQVNSNMKINQLFDKKKFTAIVAMNMLINDWHSSEQENIRYYFNVFSGKIEPIPTDFNGSSISNNFSKINDTNDIKKKLKKLPPFYHNMFYDNEFLKNFKEVLKKIHLDIPNMKKNINQLCLNFISSCYDGLNFKNIDYNYNYILSNIENIFDFKNVLETNNDEKKESIKLFKKMVQNSSIPIFKLSAEQLFIRYFSDDLIEITNLLPSSNNIINMSILYDQKIKENKDSFLCEKRINLFLNVKKFSSVLLNLADYIKEDNCLRMINGIYFKTKIGNDIEGEIYAYKEDEHYKLSNFFNKKSTTSKTNLDIFGLKNKTYLADGGEYYLEHPLIIPNGYNLKVEGNTKFYFGEDSFIYLENGSLILNSLDDRVILAPIKDSWRGIYAKNATIKINNAIIEKINFFKFKETNISLTGGLNFYKSNIEIDNLLIDKSYSEDAINLIKSNFIIKNITIINAASDAIDSDFSKGLIDGLAINNIKGDGLDTSGSDISLISLKSHNIGDKSISIGEDSIFEGRNLNIDLSNIGIAVKDGSEALIRNLKISNSKFADIMAYNKKPFYDKGGTIDIQYNDNKKLLIKKDYSSQIKLNNIFFLENNFNF